MTIDETAERLIPLPPEQVAGYEPPRLLDMVSVAGPLMARQVRGSITKDLRDLERRLTTGEE